MLVSRTLFSLFLVSSFVLVCGFTACGQGIIPNSDIDSYEKLIVHYRYDKPDSAIFFAKIGLKLAKRNNDQEGVARMLTQMGMIDDNSGKADSSRRKYLKALDIYERLGNDKGIIKEHIRLGAVENRDGNFDRAGDHFLSALRISEKSKDRSGILESYINLGELYRHKGALNKAFVYFHKAENISRALPFSNLTLNLYADMGVAYRDKGDYATAISYYETGISKSNFPEMMGLNISMINGLAQVYAKAGDINKAIGLQKGALLKSRKIRNTIREFISLTALAESYNQLNPDSSLYFLQQAFTLAKSKKANKQALEVLGTMAALHERRNNFKEAYLSKARQYMIADSFYFKDITLRMANLQTQYELNRSQAKVQQLKFVNSRQSLEQRIMMWIIAGIVLLLIVFSIYFFKIRNLNKLLNQSNMALTASNTVKDKLFSVLAHDLRSPLASVINLVEMIDKGWLTEDEKSLMMSKLAVHCNASMESLNLLLRWGQMQLKGVMINPVVIDPESIIERNISLLFESAAQKSITIDREVAGGLSVVCDADHLDFLLRNILSNAIKFTPDGGSILISAKKYGESQVVFRVKDSGVGIDPERLKSIFTINNISTNGTNNEKGTSLGLVISKEFVTANNGKIWAESRVGQGTEFYFVLNSK